MYCYQSLVVVDRADKPIGIVTELDLVRQVCVNDASSSTVIIHHIMSSPLVTIDANSSVEAAADIIIQNKVWHLLVVMDMEIDH
jgi:CBS domain-containing protein